LVVIIVEEINNNLPVRVLRHNLTGTLKNIISAFWHFFFLLACLAWLGGL
jgi:hypothetical protein